MKKHARVWLVLALAICGQMAIFAQGAATAGVKVFNIVDFGAVGDGVTVNTRAVQSAIDACTADQGGTVLVPAGVFVIGQVELKSSVTLQIAAAGRLKGSRRAEDYAAVDEIPLSGDTTLGDGNWALIYAVGATNVTVEGPGTIDGAGPPAPGLTGRNRTYALLYYRCKNITVRNINMIDCPYHMIRAIQCAYLRFDGINMNSRVHANDDGFHFVSCEYVNISNCNLLVQDDACALFGSCKFVTVTNCVFSTRWSVFRFGGGSARDISVSNCVFNGVYGCPIKFQGDPGSHFENISFSDLVFDDVTGPISISVSSPEGMVTTETQPILEPAQPAQPRRISGPVTVKNISFTNIKGTVATIAPKPTGYYMGRHYGDGEIYSAIVLNCVGSATMENISFDGVHLTFGGGGTKEHGANRDVEKRAGEYFRLGPIPAYAMYARGVRGLTMRNMRFEVATPELRPAVVFEGVTDAVIDGMSVVGNPEAESVMRMSNVKDILVSNPRALTESPTFLLVEGEASGNIAIDGGDIRKAAAAVKTGAGADPSAVIISD